ncbi:keratocan [Lissotriton helveticus]
MDVRMIPSFLVLFMSSFFWTEIQMQYYDDLDVQAFSMMSNECPSKCVCPYSFPRALYCDNKGLKEIPTIPSRIWYLYLQNNQIETISKKSFVNATGIKWINLNKNNITNRGIEKNVLRSMNNLLFLLLEDNKLEEVPAPLPSSLEQLRLARNKISLIPEGVFSNLENLTMLDLQHNKLSDSAFESGTFQGLKNLLQLNVAKNSLKKMPPSLPSNTMQLFLDNNLIEEIPKNYFNSVPRVAFIRLNYNKLSDAGIPENVFNVSSLLDLQLSYNQLTTVPPINAHLEHLYLDHNKIISVNGTTICPTAAELEQRSDPYSDNGPRLRYLRLDGNDIKPPIPIDLLVCFRLLHVITI